MTQDNSNPFAMVYSALWDTLLTHPGFAHDVKEGNRIRFDARGRDPLKVAVQAADLPEVILVPTTLSANLYDTSSSSRVTRNYSWMVNSGDFRYYVDERVPMLAAVEWYIFQGMHAWKDVLGALRWKDLPFVKLGNAASASAGLAVPDQNKNVRGWTAVWSAEVHMYFKSVDIRAELDLCEHNDIES